jgi:hypothetical protein
MPRRMIILRLSDAGGLYSSTGIPSNCIWGSTLVGKIGGRLWLDFLEFCKKIVAAFYFATVFESDEIRRTGGARLAGNFFDKVTGSFYLDGVSIPFTAEKTNGACDFVSGTIADKFRVLEVTHLLDQSFDLLLLGYRQALGMKE